MDVRWKRRSFVLGGATVALMGCNPLLAPFLLGRGDSKTPPEYPLKQPEAKVKTREDARVLILVSARPLSSDLIGIDKTLSGEFVRILEEQAKANKEKITVVPAMQVEKFKSDNTGWPLLSRVELGRKFKADYVIEVELGALSLYEPGTGRSLLKGRAVMSVAAYDIAKPTEEPAYKTEMNLEYPNGRMIEATEIPLNRFQSEFLKKLAVELTWKFTEHETRGRFAAD
jgi:hypothetical protein